MEHDGHRQRMYFKMRSGGKMPDHEMLEILLFNAYPRKNTNPIAHSLIAAFGSIKGVLEADIKELTEVEGVGENVAAYIKCIAACAASAYGVEDEDIYLKNYGEFKEFASRRLRKKTEETLEIYFCEKNGRVKYIYSETDSDMHRVKADVDELSKLLSTQKPCGIVIAHNHLSGACEPSEQDDKFTASMQMLCSLNSVILYDHCIYAADNKIFSYFDEGRIDKIKARFNLTEMLKKL